MFNDLFPIVWQDFHFLRPQFLWLLLPVILVALIGFLSMRSVVKWKKVISPHLRPYVITKGNEKVKIWMNMLLLTGFSLGVFALAGPTWKRIQQPGQELETPVVILLDLSQSMMAEDLQPNRLERAKFKINDLFKHNPRARVALIGFAGTAHTIVPLTRDYDIITSHIDGLKPSVMPFPGSDLSAALVMADSVMKVTTAPGTVVVFTDDFDDGSFDAVQKFTQNNNNKVRIVPMNTVSGSEVLSSRNTPLKDKDGHIVFSSLNENELSKLAALDRVEVSQLTLDDSDVEIIANEIKANLKFVDKPEEKKDDWRDAGLLLVIPSAFFLLLWFRKGWVLYSLFFLMLTSCSNSTRFEDLWYTKDYQGQRLSNKNDFAEAAEHYQNPMRKGVAFFKAGKYEDAIREFKTDTSAMGSYNLGLAYFENGDTLAAKMAFDQAVEKDPGFDHARSNQQLLQRITAGEDKMSVENAHEVPPEQQAKNRQNKSMEDLSGGGQEATKKDMEKSRLEETAESDIHKGKELDEVPDDIEVTKPDQNSKILMRKVDDDPSLFLKKKFAYQVKKYQIKPREDENSW